MDATKYFGGNFLKAADVVKPMQLTITSVDVEEFEDKKKLLVSFEETDKKLVLNKINMTRICRLAGSQDTDTWAGTQVTLYKDTVEYDGQDVPCIRVKKKDEAE